MQRVPSMWKRCTVHISSLRKLPTMYPLFSLKGSQFMGPLYMTVKDDSDTVCSLVNLHWCDVGHEPLKGQVHKSDQVYLFGAEFLLHLGLV